MWHGKALMRLSSLKTFINQSCLLSTKAKALSTFQPIADTTDRSSPEFASTFKENKKREAAYTQLLGVMKEGGGSKAVKRHIQQGKLVVRDRLSLLLDNVDDFFELSSTAGVGMPYGDVPSAGVVCGFGQVHGKDILVVASDGTVKAGTIFPITLKKHLRAQQIAQELSIPCVYIVDSGGGFLPLQAEIFVEGGKCFYNEAVMSSLGIPQVAVVCGMCTAGGAYIPTMADEAIMVHKTGTIFLAGPPLVKAALGEVVSAEELGGATMHSSVSGGVDHFAATEEESYKICRDVILSLNLPDVDYPTQFADPLYPIDDLNGLVTQRNPNAHQLISRLVDGSGFQEFKSRYGTSVVTGFASISGCPVGVIANNADHWSSDASTKAAHFVQLCTQRRLPIVFLVNQSENEVNADADINGQKLRSHSRFMAAVACSSVPKVTIITGAFHGVDSYAMGSKAMGSNFVFHWPSASFSMHSTDYLKGVVSESHPELSDADIEAKLNTCTGPVHAAANVWTDGVILPHQTRSTLSKVLQLFSYSKHMKVLSAESVSSKQVNFRM